MASTWVGDLLTVYLIRTKTILVEETRIGLRTMGAISEMKQ